LENLESCPESVTETLVEQLLCSLAGFLQLRNVALCLVADVERGCTIQLSATGSTGSASYVVSSVGAASSSAVAGTSLSGVRCGTPSQPWVVEAEPGQRLNISLIDFGTAAAAGATLTSTDDQALLQQQSVSSARAEGPAVSVPDDDSDQSCPSVYGFLVERGDGDSRRNVTICGGGRRRDREVHLTDSHMVNMVTSVGGVEAETADSSGNVRYFIVRFEGRRALAQGSG
jgi:hypothetical protein